MLKADISEKIQEVVLGEAKGCRFGEAKPQTPSEKPNFDSTRRSKSYRADEQLNGSSSAQLSHFLQSHKLTISLKS
jgi:hypothetical protein